MKFINARFFYEKDELINANKYSYWWILMGELKSKGESIRADDDVNTEWQKLRTATQSYNIENSTVVTLNNAYICGMSQAAFPPTVEPGGVDSKGTVVLSAKGSSGTSKIPFTVGQDKDKVGHIADSLWLLALNKDINEENVLSLFPFAVDTDTAGQYLTQKYTGVVAEKFKLVGTGETPTYIPLIGYDVVATDPVNSVNYSGFTVGESIVTLSGLITLSNNN